MNKRELVARAIAESDGRDWGTRSQNQRKEYLDNADAAIAALEPMDKPRVKPLVWEDHPADDDAVISKAVALHGTYFIVDDTDDFTGLYLQLISHDNAKWWQSVRSTCETLAENIHDDDLGPIKAAAQADYEARILAALE
jgi:hypothetical protein